MATEDDIFLKTFQEMINILKSIQSDFSSFKKTIDVLLPTIDGLGKGLSNIQNELTTISGKLDNLVTSSKNSDLSTLQKDVSQILSKFDQLVEQGGVQTIVKKPTQSKPKKEPIKQPTKKPTTSAPEPASQKASAAKDVRPQWSQSRGPDHPVFIDLTKKIKEATTFKEVGELLDDTMDQIESKFSFSRVFYEIRKFGNSLSRKGQEEMPPNEKLEVLEKIKDWEERLVE